MFGVGVGILDKKKTRKWTDFNLYRREAREKFYLYIEIDFNDK